jgi:hypothetical protein
MYHRASLRRSAEKPDLIEMKHHAINKWSLVRPWNEPGWLPVHEI